MLLTRPGKGGGGQEGPQGAPDGAVWPLGGPVVRGWGGSLRGTVILAECFVVLGLTWPLGFPLFQASESCPCTCRFDLACLPDAVLGSLS
jgi:hypothetical protein